MEIIKFEVNNFRTDRIADHLILDVGSMIIKAENNKAYFNEKEVTIVINKVDGLIRNLKSSISFTSFDEGETFYTRISDVDDNSSLNEFCNLFINNISYLDEKELAQLDKELMEFSIKNLIDYALDTKDEKLFMELTN